MDRFGFIANLLKNFWPFASTMWRDWGIQLLVTLSLCGQIFLAIFGERRRYMTSWCFQFLIWAAYLLSAYVATIALGKLTMVQVNDPTNPGYRAEMLGLLAPLLLIHLGNPNSITAYSVEDNRLGFRQLLNIVATVAFVIWVLIRCWDGNSPVSKLFFPLFLAGFIISIGWVWCLYSVYRGNSIVTFEDIDFYDEQESFKDFSDDPEPSQDEEKAASPNKLKASSKKILRAFYRFDCLKPHIVDWPYHPIFIELDHAKINEESAEDVFETTEIELGFMYDVLYTKAPILYTWPGIIGRFLVVFSIASALWGFSVIFKNTFVVDMHITYTYVVLIAVLALELYQTVLVPFSDWAVVKMIRLWRTRFMWRIISYVADICIKQRRWSRTMGQLNLLEYCHRKEFPKPVSMVLSFFGTEELAKRHRAHTRLAIPWFFKKMLHKYMMVLEEKRKQHPFNKRGDWTLEKYKTHNNDILSRSIAQGFDKCIITWHIATDVCLYQWNDEEKGSERYRCVKMISDYMMYLVALRPQLLSLTTTDITMAYASQKIKGFLRYRTDPRVFKDLLADGPLPSMEIQANAGEIHETIITSGWDVLSEVQNLVKNLRDMADKKWDVLSSIWVEMLCYAAYNCQVNYHTKMLWCGGELITHVWLILLHKTDKYETEQNKEVLQKLVSQKKNKGRKQLLCGWNRKAFNSTSEQASTS